MKFKKTLSTTLAAVILFAAAGCAGGGNSATTKNGKIKITVDRWPDKDADPAYYESMENKAKLFNEKYPEYELSGDQYAYDVQSFMAKAEGGTLPTSFGTYLTETNKLTELGYTAPITKQMKDFGYYDNLNGYILEEISYEGDVYYIPTNVYTLGIVINLDIYKEAGFVSDDGTPYAPETFEDLARVAKEIKEKTGVAGFVMPTSENVGGWNFMPIAWSYGTEFMKADKDGKYTSTFDSDECAQALNLLKKMRWEDNSLPENTLINATEAIKLVGTGQAAMTMGHPAQAKQLKSYGLDIDSVGMVKMPAGPKAHVTLLGGNITAVRSDATEEQIEGIFKWEELNGETYKIDDESKKSIEEKYALAKEKGDLIGIKDLSIWKDSAEKQSFTDAMIDKYININPNHVKSYNDKDGIEYKVEEPSNTQDLYKLLDGCIQEVLTKKNSDAASLLKTASETFQSNFLDD